MKRKDYINWDEMFMLIAENASKRSKDPSTRHGSCIVRDNLVLSVGYNGLPRGLDDDGIDVKWEPSCEDMLLKYQKESGSNYYDYWDRANKQHFACHSEENAILNSDCSLKGSKLYLFSEKGYYPCSTCARMIVQKGIVEVIMKTAIKAPTDIYNWDYTKHMFKKANIKIRILQDI